MGVGLNTMLAAVGAGGVAASKVASSFNSSGGEQDTQISQANDGELSAKMADKARRNALANIKNILAQKQLSEKARSRRINKELKSLQGGNK